MDAKTLEALKASIAKWEKNAEAETPAEYLISVENCALCGLFYDYGCKGCPVKERTGYDVCYGSPYIFASGARSRWAKGSSKSARKEAHEAARAEVTFLKSLLPTEG